MSVLACLLPYYASHNFNAYLDDFQREVSRPSLFAELQPHVPSEHLLVQGPLAPTLSSSLSQPLAWLEAS